MPSPARVHPRLVCSTPWSRRANPRKWRGRRRTPRSTRAQIVADKSSNARTFPGAGVRFFATAADGDPDIRLRFFNTRKEPPFVGHATVAAHAALLALGRRGEGVIRQHSGTGIIEVRVHEQDGPQIEFRQNAPELDAPLPFKTTLRVAEALRLPATHLHEVMPARIAHRGSSRLLLPVADSRALEALAPNSDTLLALGKELKLEGFFVFAVNRSHDEFSTDSRMFCPALGFPEDPVSGNAHAMLAAYLWELGQFGKSVTTFTGRQGRHMNRPGEVDVRLEIDDGSLVAAHIGGGAVIVSEGTLAL